ncbi:MAG: hypothetical protein OXF07_02920 [Rhodobacter sp.]|nr:hypothetical protein [Rhodobacter sp.]
MADEHDRPLLNPVLSLRMDPAPESSRGGGKGKDSIVKGRLNEQKEKIGGRVQELHASRAEVETFGDRTLLTVQMFPDSLATSHTPTDLFPPERGCRFMAPLPNGYLIEADPGQFESLAAEIRRPRGYKVQADISRVSGVHIFDRDALRRGGSVKSLWRSAPRIEGGRFFVVWLAPFQDRQAREALLGKVAELSDDRALLPVFSRTLLPRQDVETSRETRTDAVPRRSSLARAMRNYRNTGVGYGTVLVPDRGRLKALVTSGTAFRIDPVRQLVPTSPGEATHPVPPVPAWKRRPRRGHRGRPTSCQQLPVGGGPARQATGPGSRCRPSAWQRSEFPCRPRVRLEKRAESPGTGMPPDVPLCFSTIDLIGAAKVDRFGHCGNPLGRTAAAAIKWRAA